MPQQFLFFYLMIDDAEKTRSVVPAHISYWKGNKPLNFIGGPFGDRSGGLIMFEADTLQEAERLIRTDPFVIEEVIAHQWVKSWLPER